MNSDTRRTLSRRTDVQAAKLRAKPSQCCLSNVVRNVQAVLGQRSTRTQALKHERFGASISQRPKLGEDGNRWWRQWDDVVAEAHLHARDRNHPLRLLSFDVELF